MEQIFSVERSLLKIWGTTYWTDARGEDLPAPLDEKYGLVTNHVLNVQIKSVTAWKWHQMNICQVCSGYSLITYPANGFLYTVKLWFIYKCSLLPGFCKNVLNLQYMSHSSRCQGSYTRKHTMCINNLVHERHIWSSQ